MESSFVLATRQRLVASVSTPETPRTWTLYPSTRGTVATGQGPEAGKSVRVVEKAFVDAERERLLDLLEETLVGGLISEGVRRRVMVALREYGRSGHRRPER